MLNSQTHDEAVAFSQWRRDDTVDSSIKCTKCEKYYDYRIYLVHTCTPVAKQELGFVPSVNG